MNQTIDLVKEFHEVFDVGIEEKPTIVDADTFKLRISLIDEEVEELFDAYEEHDIEEIFDALLDIQYVLDGAFLAFGMHKVKEEGFRRVHETNMNKLFEGRVLRNSDGKVVKPEGWTPPVLGDLVNE